MNNYKIAESYGRCSKIISQTRNFRELITNIDNAISEDYTKEQCYEDLFKCYGFWSRYLFDFAEYIIFFKREDINLLLKNLKFLNETCLSELVDELTSDKECRNVLIEGIKNGILAQYEPANSLVFLKFLLSEKEGPQIVIDRFEDFFVKGYDMKIVQKMIATCGLSEEKIIKNKDKILKNSYGENIIKFIKWFSERGAFSKGDINLHEFVNLLYFDIEDEPSLNMIETIYKELMEKQKQKISLEDISFLGGGENSKAYKIGQFVLKIGEFRQTETIPYHRRILQPLVRQHTNPNNRNNLYIEIQNSVDPKWYERKTEEEIEEELYQIYKEMRKDGIIWSDLKKENVGRLIEPNRTNYYAETLVGDINNEQSLEVVNKELEVSDEAVGMIDRKQEECLQPGELVILDTDYIFKAEDIDFEKDMTSRTPHKYVRFEMRYRYELKQQMEER